MTKPTIEFSNFGIDQKNFMPKADAVAKPVTCRTFSARAIIAIVLVGLFVLQGLVFSVPSHVRLVHGGTNPDVLAWIGGEHCIYPDAHGDGKPAPEQHDHSQCYIRCAFNDQGGSFHQLATLASSIVFPAPRATAPIIRFAFYPSVGRPLGWVSSWSSRAPPSFS